MNVQVKSGSRFIDDFEQYVARVTPEWLRLSEAPDWIPQDAWDTIRPMALAQIRQERALEFLGRLERGWRSHELATNRPDHDFGGARLAGDQPTRNHSQVSNEVHATAAELASLMRRTGTRLEPIFEVRFNYVLSGAEVNEDRAKATVQEARRQIEHQIAENRARSERAPPPAKVWTSSQTFPPLPPPPVR